MPQDSKVSMYGHNGLIYGFLCYFRHDLEQHLDEILTPVSSIQMVWLIPRLSGLSLFSEYGPKLPGIQINLDYVCPNDYSTNKQWRHMAEL